ncbi:MAG: hypothetical protein HQM14_15840 [SAR324 cluster bacterium]|nr:hypothetical protein [SAR324 cluster bacterium]
MEKNLEKQITINNAEISSRLDEFIHSEDRTISSIARQCGLAISHLGDVVRGSKNITASMLKALVEYKRLNPTWLLVGEGEKYLESEEIQADGIPDPSLQDEKIRELLESNNKLLAENTVFLREKIDQLEKELDEQAKDQSKPLHLRRKINKLEGKLIDLMTRLGYSKKQINNFLEDEVSARELAGRITG